MSKQKDDKQLHGCTSIFDRHRRLPQHNPKAATIASVLTPRRQCCKTLTPPSHIPPRKPLQFFSGAVPCRVSSCLVLKGLASYLEGQGFAACSCTLHWGFVQRCCHARAVCAVKAHNHDCAPICQAGLPV